MIYDQISQLKKDLTVEGRLIALDVGTKIIGVAISDSLRIISNPKSIITRQGNKKDFLIIQKIIAENNIHVVVIGLPLNMDGSESEMSSFVRRFADNLDQFLKKAKIIFFDERLSSFEAEELINKGIGLKKTDKKGLIDQVAASLILQSFLDQLSRSF